MQKKVPMNIVGLALMMMFWKHKTVMHVLILCYSIICSNAGKKSDKYPKESNP